MIMEFQRNGWKNDLEFQGGDWRSKGGLSILEFSKAVGGGGGGLDEEAAHGRVRIFTGITYSWMQESLKSLLQRLADTLSNLPPIYSLPHPLPAA